MSEPRFPSFRLGRLAMAVPALLVVASAARAIEFTEDHAPISGEVNQAAVSLNGNDPKVANVIACGADESYLNLRYDNLASEVSIEDGALCAEDISFLGTVIRIEDIQVLTGPSAEAVYPIGDFPPITSTIGASGGVFFQGLSAVFTAHLFVFGADQGVIVTPAEIDLIGAFGLNDGTGRTELLDLTGALADEIQVPGFGSVSYVADLTLNLESVTLAPEIDVFDDDFESGDMNGWDSVVGPL